MVKKALDMGWENDGPEYSRYTNINELQSRLLLPRPRNEQAGCLERLEIRNQVVNVLPVWKDINARYTADELFNRIITLISRDSITVEEVEETFGIKLALVNSSQGSSKYRAKVEGDKTKSNFDGFYFALDESEHPFPEWRLHLDGLSDGLQKSQCIRYGVARQRLLGMGWKELPDEKNFFFPSAFVPFFKDFEKPLKGGVGRLSVNFPHGNNHNVCLRSVHYRSPEKPTTGVSGSTAPTTAIKELPTVANQKTAIPQPSPPLVPGSTASSYTAKGLLAKIMKLANLPWATLPEVEEALEIKFKPPVSEFSVDTVFTSEPDASGYRFVYSKEERRKTWTLKVIDIDSGKHPGNCLLHPDLVRTFLDTGWEFDSQSFRETKYEKTVDGLFSTVLSSPHYTRKLGCLASMVLTNRSIGIVPVWKDINSCFTSDELFKTVMRLASQDWVTPKQVEEAFGIRFKPPQIDKGSIGNIYVAEGDNTRDGNSFVLGSALKLFHNENSTSPSWTLILSGFSNGLSKDKCINYTDARKTILDMGWEEVPIPNAIRYEKHSDHINSILHIRALQPINDRRCLEHIQFSNQLRVSPSR